MFAWVRRRSRRRVASMVVVLLAACSALAACSNGSAAPNDLHGLPSGPYSTRPNIVFVLTDDLTTNLVRYMPHVIALEHEGLSFSNYTVTDSLCCPSRASIFTGRFPHNTKIFGNGPPDGGYGLFANRGENEQTFALPLHNAGYRTAFMGKYLNGFQVPSGERPTAMNQAHYVPPGWSTWDGAGYAYDEFDYDLDENGVLHHYGSAPQDYLTRVMGRLARHFIAQSARARKPFFLETATFAPHTPSTPETRDVGTFHLDAPRGPSFNRHPSDAPQWLASIPKLTPFQIRRMDHEFTLRVESVQAVDRMIGRLEKTLQRTHQLSNTVFIFSSDNGYHLGEHGMSGGKLTAFDTDVRVPLVIVGPGIARGSTNADVVENVDLAPTFEQLAGAVTPATVDGRSFVPLLHGQNPPWRTLATIEHRGPVFGPFDPDAQSRTQGNPPTYVAIRSPTFTYVLYADGQREYYDRTTDPYEMHNIAGSLPPSRITALDRTLERLHDCRGTTQCWAAADPTTG